MNNRLQEIQPAGLKQILKEKELWLLVLLGVLYFYRPLFLRETFFFRDLFSIFLTQKQLLTDFIKAGEFPLWDPYLHGGRPYFANTLNSPLYPSNLLYVFLPYFRAFNLNIVLHFICYPVFAYLFSRFAGLRQVSSLIVGVVYGFCGYTLSLVNLLNMFLAMTHLPLLLLFWHLFLLRGKRTYFVMTVVIGVIQVFAGSPEINIISLLFLLGWMLCYPYYKIPIPRKIILWFLLGVFIVGIASVQIFPLGEMVIHSSRGYGMSYAAFSKWSLDPRRLPELFFPEFSGRVGAINWSQHYWGSRIFSENVPLFLSIYFGCVATFLLIVGGLYKGDNDIFPFRVRIFFLSVFACSLLLSLGRFLSFFSLLYQYIPFMTLFRFPVKFLSAGIFPFALLVGYASEVHFGYSRNKEGGTPPYPPSRGELKGEISSSKFLGILWGIAVILILFAIMFWFSDGVASRFQEFFFKQSGDVMRWGIGSSLIHAAAIWLLMTLLYQYRRLRRVPWQQWVLVGILLVDLLIAGKRVNLYAPENLFTEVPELVQVVHREIKGGRLFRTEDLPFNLKLLTLPDDVIWIYRWSLEALDNSFATFFRIPIIFHVDFDRLAHVHIMHLKALIESLPWEQRLPLLSAGGVTLIISSEDVSIPGMEGIGSTPDWSNARFYLYRNNTAAARVEFVTSWKKVDADADALGNMLIPGYDPRKHVILQEPESMFSLLFSKKQPQNDFITVPINRQQARNIQEAGLSLTKCGPVQITNLESSLHISRFSVLNSCDGYLVFSEPFYPGWKVSLDGKSTTVLRANYAFSAIFLPAGEHEVKRLYRPTSLLVGAVSSVVFGCVLLFVMYRQIITW